MTIKQQGGVFGRNPTFNNADVDGTLNAAEAQIDNINIDGNTIHTVTGDLNLYADAPSNVVLGNASGRSLTFDDNTSNLMLLSAERTLELRSNGGYQARLNAANSFGSVALQVNSDTKLIAANDGNITISNGNLVIGTSGKGIDFSATSGTGTSELFDDYEEGTWTPVLGGSSGTSGQTYAKQVGLYTKIGNTVHAQCYVQLSAEGTVTGSLILDGLPFASANVTDAYGAGCISQFVNLGSNVVEMSLRTNVNASYAFVFGLAAAATGSGALSAPTFLTNSTVIAASLTYKAA